MTPSANQEAQASSPVSKQEHEDVFEDFITFVGKFCTGKSYQRLKTIAEDNDTLRKQLEDTKTAYGRNMEELTQRTAAWGHEKETFEKKILEQSKQHRKAADEKATVDRKLKAEQDAAAGLKEQIKKLENDARRLIANSKKHEERVVNLEHDIEGQNKQLEAARKEKAKLKDELKSTSDRLGAQSEVLSTAERKLEMFQSYTAALTSLDDVRESIPEMLSSSFNQASELFRAFLGNNLGPDQLQDPRSWDNVRDHVAIRRAIPIPVSNSTHSKRMRTIAGLVIYSWALAEHVFRSTYLPLGTEAYKVLDALPATDPFQDMLVRAVLLKVAPDQQKTCRDASSAVVVRQVLAAVASWIPAKQHAEFKSRLNHVTSIMCGKWERMQRLNERVKPCFVFETPDDWQTLPTWADATLSENGVRTIAPPQGSRERQQEAGPAALSTGDVVRIVWPAFLATGLERPTDEEEYPSELVHPGYVLTRDDIQGAADEEMPRRAIRRATRNNNNNNNTIEAQRRRRDSAVFLSHGASDGSDVK